MPKLSALTITKGLSAGRYGDGDGLYLLVGPKGRKSWVFRYKVGKRERGMGLGPFPTISLADARSAAAECRRLRASGLDPLKIKEKRLADFKDSSRRGTPFRRCAESYLESHEPSWKNAKHRQQWRNTLATYAYPHIGQTAVSEIDVPTVLEVLEPIWNKLPETASRLRGRLEAILDWAKAKRRRTVLPPSSMGAAQCLLCAKSGHPEASDGRPNGGRARNHACWISPFFQSFTGRRSGNTNRHTNSLAPHHFSDITISTPLIPLLRRSAYILTNGSEG